MSKNDTLAEARRKIAIAEELAQGASRHSVEVKYHIGYRGVNKIADEFGITIQPSKPKRVVTPEDIEQMESMARQGKSFAEVCKAIGKKSGTLWRYWQKIQEKLANEQREDKQPNAQAVCEPAKREKLLMDALSRVYDVLSAAMAALQMDMSWFKEQ